MTGGDWVVAVSYKTLGPDLAGMTIDPHQRVGVVVELRDDDERSLGPQTAIQALPIAAEMDALSVYSSRVPVQVRVDT